MIELSKLLSDHRTHRNNLLIITLFIYIVIHAILYSYSQDIRIGIIECVTMIIKKIHIDESVALGTITCICNKQIWDFGAATWHENVSEELKMATIECIDLCFQKSTGEVLQEFYCFESAGVFGQLLLTLVQVIGTERYKQLWLVPFYPLY